MKTKKLFRILTALTIVFAGGFCTTAKAGGGYEEGIGTLHLGIGFPSLLATYSGSNSTGTPPISASYEYGVTDNISAGAYVGYASAKYTYSDAFFSNGGTYGWKYSFLIIAARGSYHFGDADKFDPYVGAMLGYNVASVKYFSSDPTYVSAFGEASAGGVTFSGHIGANYMFSDNVGAFAELGYGIAIINLGLALHL